MTGAVQIVVNGESREVDGNITVAELVSRLGLPTERIAVERNRKIIRKQDWHDVEVAQGDRFEIVHFVGGG